MQSIEKLLRNEGPFLFAVQPGKNVLTRQSLESSVTLSKVPTFEELAQGDILDSKTDEYCSCGWPEHMLVPRGTARGMVFHLFVMLTDYEQDKVSKHCFTIRLDQSSASDPHAAL